MKLFQKASAAVLAVCGVLSAVPGAQAAGLQWVQSDAEKIAAVQAAIAAEPAAIRIPRERPAPVVLDDAPLILVETRKDLSDLRLSFEPPNCLT